MLIHGNRRSFQFRARLAKQRLQPSSLKIFDFEIFRSKYSESIPTKKIFDQNFLTLSFFHYFGPFGRKTTKSEQKKFTRVKIFDFEISGLKYVLNYSESIPTQKIFF